MSEPKPQPRKRPVKKALLFIGLPFIAMIGLVLPKAFAHGGWARRHMNHMTTEDAKETAGFFAGRVLAKVDATDQQVESVQATLDQFIPQILSLRGDRSALREQAIQILTAETVDSAELETIRKQALVLAEKASMQMVDALKEISTTLTLEQRQQLVDHWRARHR
jgi:Spy/CpxP family protein refolding chaperone